MSMKFLSYTISAEHFCARTQSFPSGILYWANCNSSTIIATEIKIIQKWKSLLL